MSEQKQPWNLVENEIHHGPDLVAFVDIAACLDLDNPVDKQMLAVRSRKLCRLIDCANACEGINPEAVKDMLAALKGVLAVADRKTKEFDAARAVIAKAELR